MRISTTSLKWICPALLWIALWQAAYMLIGKNVLFASPIQVAQCLTGLAADSVFWQTIGFSFLRIFTGFALALVCGTLLAVLAARFAPVERLMAPLILMVQSIPVASIVILILVWVSSSNLSVIVCFMMVLPVSYTNILRGIRSMDTKLTEMAELFGIPTRRRVLRIYLSQVLPFFRAACTIGLGMCWKMGIGAEIIGLPKGSIGEKLYQAKIYLKTPDLFAWTFVVIAISILFEHLFNLLVQRCISAVERS